MTVHRFDGKVALVTGAGSGLGYQHAVSLARLGAKVMVNDLRSEHGGTPEEATAAEVAEQIRSEGFEAEGDQGSVADEAYAVGLVDRTVERFGTIDILINNAGRPAFGQAHDTTTELMRESLAVNLLGSFWTMRAALAVMREKDYGRIVNTASGTATFGSAGMLAYVTAKGGVLGMTKGAALENLDRNIRVNALCPIAYTVMGREYFGSRSHLDLATLDTAYVSPVALYLSHEECTTTGEVISAGAGKWSRVITGKTSGPEKLSFDLDDVFANLDEILDPSSFAVPASAQAQYDR